MLTFVHQESYEVHREYQRKEALMLSVEEKKYPKYAGMSIPDLVSASKSKPELSRLTALRASVKLHDVYFSSFGERENIRCEAARRYFGSETAMLSELYDLAMEIECGFVGIATDRNKAPFLFSAGYSLSGCEKHSPIITLPKLTRRRVYRRQYPKEIFILGNPLLAIDLYEHAYFDGYTFDKERYISSALGALRADALDKL